MSRKITKDEMLDEVCSLIYYQSSLKHQDRWLEMMIDMGMWEKPDEQS